MNVLITGINGFIGKSVAERLRRRGDSVIFGIDLQPESTSACCDDYLALDLGVPAAAGRLRELPAFDTVLHAGGISGFMVETENPQRIFEVNIAGTMAVLEMVRRMPCRRLVLCSTVMVYGPDAQPVADHDESEYPVPISVYGASKLAQEALMHAYVVQYGVDAIALRLAHVYGPGRTTECFVREMLRAAAAGRRCAISQARGSLRQFIHIDDVVDSVELAMRVEAPRSRVFNISAGELHTLAEVADEVRRTVGPLEVVFDESRDLPNYRIGRLSIERARADLGFDPRLPLAAGLREYWKTFRREVPPAQTPAGSRRDPPRA